MTDYNPWGRFSLRHIDQRRPKAEFDERVRFRLKKLVYKSVENGDSYNMAKFIESELGIRITARGLDSMFADWH